METTLYIKKEIRGGRMEIITEERELALYSNPEIYQLFKITGMEEVVVNIGIIKK